MKCPRCKADSPNTRICNGCGYVIDADLRETYRRIESLEAEATLKNGKKRRRG